MISKAKQHRVTFLIADTAMVPIILHAVVPDYNQDSLVVELHH